MTDCPYCAPDELCAIHLQAPEAQVIQRAPEIIVLPSEKYDHRDDDSFEIDPFVNDLVTSTGALVICVPGGRLETLTLDEAQRCLEEVISRKQPEVPS